LDTLWDLASLTKRIVALAAMALLDRGLVRLDDSIGFFPGLGDVWLGGSVE